MSEAPTQCKVCGAAITQTPGSGRHRLFCSRYCQQQDKKPDKHCLHCGKNMGKAHGRRKYCSESCAWRYRNPKPEPRSYDKQCKHCGVSFTTPTKTRKYCDQCGGNGLKFRPYGSRAGLPRTRIHPGVCARCGAEFMGEKRCQRYCGPTCGRSISPPNKLHHEVWVHRRWAKSVRASVKQRADSERRKRKQTAARMRRNIIIVSDCHECGDVFDSRVMLGKVYCTSECGQKARRRRHKQRRRAAEVGNGLDSTVVFDAYDWQCAYCRVETPRHLRGSCEDNAPELDHVVPLAKGGEHSYANTQLLCRSCNGAKSDLYIQRVSWVNKGVQGGLKF